MKAGACFAVLVLLSGVASAQKKPASPGLDLERIESTKAQTVRAGQMMSHVALCPAGKQPLSGGFLLSRNPERFALADSYPVNRTWRVDVINSSSVLSHQELTVFALCGRF